MAEQYYIGVSPMERLVDAAPAAFAAFAVGAGVAGGANIAQSAPIDHCMASPSSGGLASAVATASAAVAAGGALAAGALGSLDLAGAAGLVGSALPIAGNVLQGFQNKKANEKQCVAVREGAHVGGHAGASEAVQSLTPEVQTAARDGADAGGRAGAIAGVQSLTPDVQTAAKDGVKEGVEAAMPQLIESITKNLEGDLTPDQRALYQQIVSICPGGAREGDHDAFEKLMKLMSKDSRIHFMQRFNIMYTTAEACNDQNKKQMKTQYVEYLSNIEKPNLRTQVKKFNPKPESKTNKSLIDPRLAEIREWVGKPSTGQSAVKSKDSRGIKNKKNQVEIKRLKRVLRRKHYEVMRSRVRANRWIGELKRALRRKDSHIRFQARCLAALEVTIEPLPWDRPQSSNSVV